MPQSGAGISRSAGTWASAARMRSATTSGVSASGSPRSSTPTMTVLGGEVGQLTEVELGLCGLHRDLLSGAVGELAQEVVAGCGPWRPTTAA